MISITTTEYTQLSDIQPVRARLPMDEPEDPDQLERTRSVHSRKSNNYIPEVHNQVEQEAFKIEEDLAPLTEDEITDQQVPEEKDSIPTK